MSIPVADAPLDTDRVSHSADVAEPGADWLRAVTRHVRERLACDDLEWQRGEAWAFEQAMGVVWYYVDSNPAMSHMGRRTLDRVMAEVSPG